MKNKILILILILAHSVVSATEKTWDGGGGNSNWGNAANWNSDVLPGSTDNVTIGTGVSVTMTADYTTTGTLTLSGTGTIQMAGYNLTIGGLTGSVGSIINNSGTSKNLTLNQSTWTTFSGSITGNICYFCITHWQYFLDDDKPTKPLLQSIFYCNRQKSRLCKTLQLLL